MTEGDNGVADALRPAIVAIDDDADACEHVERELTRRYAPDYRIFVHADADVALARLAAMRERGEPVALVLADQWLGDRTGSDTLAEARRLHPLAKHALLIDWGGWGDHATAEAIHRAMALGRIDYYVLKPWRSPDELFHRTVAELVHEWSRAVSGEPREVELVAPRRSARGHELRSLLARNGVPHAFYAAESDEGRRLLAEAGLAGTTDPVVRYLDGTVLVDPTNAKVAHGFGVMTGLEGETEFDVAIVGAGPAGLAAAVYASSEGLRALVVERESIGGQAGSSSLIRNYLGFSRGISGAELAQRAYQQAWVFGTRFVLMRSATELTLAGDGRLALAIEEQEPAHAGAVVLASGVAYRRLGIPSLEGLTGAGVFYGASTAEATGLAGGRAFVVGGGNSAGQAAMHLSRHAAEVAILVRGRSLAASMSQYLIDAIDAAPNVEVRTGVEVAGGGGEGRLERLVLRDVASGETTTEPADGLFVLIGAAPHTDWLPSELRRDAWGYVLTGPDLRDAAEEAGAWPLERPPLGLETSVPGVFAVGDVRHASIKRVATAAGQGAAVVQQVHEHLAARDAAAVAHDAGGPAWR